MCNIPAIAIAASQYRNISDQISHIRFHVLLNVDNS